VPVRKTRAAAASRRCWTGALTDLVAIRARSGRVRSMGRTAWTTAATCRLGGGNARRGTWRLGDAIPVRRRSRPSIGPTSRCMESRRAVARRSVTWHDRRHHGPLTEFCCPARPRARPPRRQLPRRGAADQGLTLYPAQSEALIEIVFRQTTSSWARPNRLRAKSLVRDRRRIFTGASTVSFPQPSRPHCRPQPSTRRRSRALVSEKFFALCGHLRPRERRQ